MKLRKRIAALGAAMTMAVSMMSIGASASKADDWFVHAQYALPTSTNKYEDTGVVKYLNPNTDTGLTFHATSYVNNSHGYTPYLYGIITSPSIAATRAYITRNAYQDTAAFVYNWYQINKSSTVYFKVRGFNMGRQSNDSIQGYTN